MHERHINTKIADLSSPAAVCLFAVVSCEENIQYSCRPSLNFSLVIFGQKKEPPNGKIYACNVILLCLESILLSGAKGGVSLTASIGMELYLIGFR